MSDKIYEVRLSTGTVVRVQRASAVNQKTLLFLLGSRLSLLTEDNELSEEDKIATIVGSLIMLGEQVFDKAASLVLPKAVVADTSDVADLAYFHNNVTSYAELVAHAIKENLQDFFVWLQNDSSQTGMTTTIATNLAMNMMNQKA